MLNSQDRGSRMKNQTHHARHRMPLILTLVGLMSSVTLMPGPARIVSAQAAAPNWSYTGNLKKARDLHTATLLPNGKILVAGGDESISSGNSAELYEPATGTWRISGTEKSAH